MLACYVEGEVKVEVEVHSEKALPSGFWQTLRSAAVKIKTSMKSRDPFLSCTEPTSGYQASQQFSDEVWGSRRVSSAEAYFLTWGCKSWILGSHKITRAWPC